MTNVLPCGSGSRGANSPKRPRQAVILAGGGGTRMRPLSDTRPKAMVDINGRPFLEYLIEMLRDQGFERVLLLLGYLPEVIQDYFQNGENHGVRIEYSVTAVENNTGKRLKLAERQLEPNFLLLYCDNYWPMQWDRMWSKYLALDVPAMLTVYLNPDGYTKNSVRVDEAGYFTAYDKRGSVENLQGVEISYGIFDRSVLRLLPEDNVALEEALFPQLIEKRQLGAYMTEHRYYSIGGLARLPLTETFLARRPAIILDRDGVLNRRAPRAEYIRTWQEFEWLPGVKEALALLRQARFRVSVVSNQAGIARGAMTEAGLLNIHQEMQREAARAGGRIDAFFYCPHHWDAGCSCRKPKPGMLYLAQRTFNLDLSRTWFVGDDERDAQAAQAAGCPFEMITETNSLWDFVSKLVKNATPWAATSLER